MDRLRNDKVRNEQKRKLIQLVAKNPEIIVWRKTQDGSYKEAQRIWCNIASECNKLPGAKKPWIQWKRTFINMRVLAKKKQRSLNGMLPSSADTLNPEERAVLGYVDTPLFESNNESDEDVLPQEQVMVQAASDCGSSVQNNKQNNSESKTKLKKVLSKKRKSNDLSASCTLSCKDLVNQEVRRNDMKEDYLRFKKTYLSQKLRLLREQTEAIKTIANELLK